MDASNVNWFTFVVQQPPGTNQNGESKQPPAMPAVDLSLIGGTNFAAQNAPHAYGYNIIGFGGATTSAYESYTVSGNARFGISGVLQNIAGIAGVQTSSPGNQYYAFRPADVLGMAFQYDANNNAQLTVDYNTANPAHRGRSDDPPELHSPSYRPRHNSTWPCLVSR